MFVNSVTELVSRSPEETSAAGRRFAAGLRPGDVVLMQGGLGAGKTLFTKAAVGALGFDECEVTSPSFALVNLYETDRCDVFHIDLWRLEPGPDTIFAVGLDEILDGGRAIVFIEWADRIGLQRLGERTFVVNISGDGDDERIICIERFGEPGETDSRVSRDLLDGGDAVGDT